VNERAVTPAVSKVFEIGLVVLYVSLVTATLYGGIVPDYRTATGDELAERSVATAAQRIQQAVPPNATVGSATTSFRVPETIRGTTYRFRIENRTLVLDHPDHGIEARGALVVPQTVESIAGNWSSRSPARVHVRQGTGGYNLSVTNR
jgi:hypothetical protein